jgi:YVTN family beta-propeller protein
LNSFVTTNKIYVTGKNPDAIIYDPFSKKIFVFNGLTSNATVIDARTEKVIQTIPLEGKPEYAVSDLHGKIYVNIEDKNKISVINSNSMAVEQTWSVGQGEEPSGLAMDMINHRLFIVCDNKLMVIMDAISGMVITSLAIGEHVDGCAFDPDLKRIYSSNGDGTLTVIQQESPDNYRVIENVTTQKGARTISIDSYTHHIYLPSAEFGIPLPTSKENPHPHHAIIPGTFVILDLETLN